MIHISNIKQTAKIVEIKNVVRNTRRRKAKSDHQQFDEDIHGNPVLRAGDRATVRFQFRYWAPFINLGEKILFREGRTRGVGIIKELSTVSDVKKHEHKAKKSNKTTDQTTDPTSR